MIAKLATWGATRDDAIATMQDALDAFYIRGLNHNVAFLAAILGKPRFRAGALTTGFIAEEFPEGFRPGDLPADAAVRMAAVAVVAHLVLRRRERAISGRRNGALAAGEPAWHVRLGAAGYDVAVTGAPEDCRVRFDSESDVRESDRREVAIRTDWRLGQPLFRAEIDGRPVTVQIERKGIGWRLVHGGAVATAMVMTRRAAALARQMPEKAPPDTSRFLLSPMPGLLVSLAVKAGQAVRAGEELAVVEAMKMQNVLRAEQDATVKTLHAAPGESLAVDQAIIEFA
jgi:propionyl-CoA carboxylase alpha chain